MADGDTFFTAAEVKRTRPLPMLRPKCEQCGLYKGCESPKMAVTGQGRRGVLLVSDYPGKAEDLEGRQFVGKSGRYMEEVLQGLGFNMRRDAWLTNALICHNAKKEFPRTSTDDCRPNLMNTIRDLKPRVIILAGGVAISSLLGVVWKPDVGPAVRWTGRTIPAHKPNAWIAPVNNPAYLFREGVSPVAKLQFREHLEAAIRLADTEQVPWPNGPPDYASQVEVIHSPTEAAARLRKYDSGLVAFDFETDRLKPDHRDAEIMCCSVCWEGQETIAFPWHGPVVAEMKRLLVDRDIGKIGFNMDFEHRWCKAKLGIDVKGWAWDGMLGAHCLDPRPGGKSKEDGSSFGSGCTGLKYQAFVRFGIPEYNSAIEPYLRSEGGGNSVNRVREVKPDRLMLYCGLDSLFEFMVAKDQSKEMGAAL